MSTEADTKSHYSVSGWLFDLSSFCWQTLSPWENIALGEGHAHWLSLPRVHGGPGRCEAFGGGWDNTSRLGCAKLLDCNPHLLAIGIRPVYGFLGASPRTRPFSTLCARPRCSRLRIYPLVFPPTEALPDKTQFKQLTLAHPCGSKGQVNSKLRSIHERISIPILLQHVVAVISPVRGELQVRVEASAQITHLIETKPFAELFVFPKHTSQFQIHPPPIQLRMEHPSLNVLRRQLSLKLKYAIPAIPDGTSQVRPGPIQMHLAKLGIPKTTEISSRVTTNPSCRSCSPTICCGFLG